MIAQMQIQSKVMKMAMAEKRVAAYRIAQKYYNYREGDKQDPSQRRGQGSHWKTELMKIFDR